MRTVTLDQASADLKNIVLRTIRDQDETVIVSNEGAVVVLDENEWSNIKETLRLLSDKKSLTALLESHAIRDRGKKPEGVTAEEAFSVRVHHGKTRNITDEKGSLERGRPIKLVPPICLRQEMRITTGGKGRVRGTDLKAAERFR